MAEKQQIKQWGKWCEQVQQFTTVDPHETPADKQRRIRRAKRDYDFFVRYYFPHYAKSRCADFHIKAANRIRKDDRFFGVLMWPRGHAKSTHANVFLPTWLKFLGKLRVMVTVGKSETDAQDKLSNLQAELQYNQRIINDFGKQYNYGHWADSKFITKDNCAFFAKGRGQSPRGLIYRQHRPDYIAVDDIDDEELSRNERRVKDTTDWVMGALFNTVNLKSFRFLMVGNRFAQAMVLNQVARRPGIYVSHVNAIDKNGQPAWKERFSAEELKAIKRFSGWIVFEREYMHNPIQEGRVWKNDWIQFKKLPPLEKYDELVAYFDPSWKSGKQNDYKAIKVWGKIGKELHCVRAFVRQCSIKAAVEWLYDLHESLPTDVICDYYMEATFMQDLLLDEFGDVGEQRGYQLPIRPDKRKKPDKYSRIESMSPLWERGLVFYNQAEKDNPDMKTGIQQLMAFEKGSAAPDDGPDADEGAIYLLQQRARVQRFTPQIGRRVRAGW